MKQASFGPKGPGDEFGNRVQAIKALVQENCLPAQGKVNLANGIGGAQQAKGDAGQGKKSPGGGKGMSIDRIMSASSLRREFGQGMRDAGDGLPARRPATRAHFPRAIAPNLSRTIRNQKRSPQRTPRQARKPITIGLFLTSFAKTLRPLRLCTSCGRLCGGCLGLMQSPGSFPRPAR
jgi:hypothetical protein